VPLSQRKALQFSHGECGSDSRDFGPKSWDQPEHGCLLEGAEVLAFKPGRRETIGKKRNF